ncbi:MAG TPA: xanthine dehydrogenase family protein molybdopterin-binding subunit [Candidatus Methylomirabilis sp.]|nr:xanthine dehydrogenase family protein molybdopterin-binding subunit [Candidatus Methylomirabilis sp.]
MDDHPGAIGSSPRRKEDLRLLLGGGRYLDDITRDGLLHLGVVRSSHAHARVLDVDVRAARDMPGVIAAWSAADLPETTRPILAGSEGVHRGRPFAAPVVAHRVVRYVGEPVAAVVADSVYRLADAMERVKVEYEPLPALVNPEDALASPSILHDGWPDNAAVVARGSIGDAERALGEAEVVVSERLRHARLSAVFIEPRGALAYKDPDSGGLVLWSSTQNPYAVRDAVARILGLPAEELRVRTPDVGGGFGPKGSPYPEEVLVALAAQRLGRPVKYLETRREDFAASGHDREQVHQVRIGFRKDGTIAGIDATFLADVGAYPAQGTGLTLNTVNHLPGPYRVAHYRNAGTSVVTNKTLNMAYRAAGRPEAVFVMERLMDVGARRLGLDPAEIRRRNLVRPEDMPYRPGLAYKDGAPVSYDPADFPAAFERALQLLGYDDWRRRQATQKDGARRIGVGVACYAQGTGLGPFESATIRVDPTGKVYVLIGVAAQGQGHATTLAQVCAEELGAAFEDVIVTSGDTMLVPFGMGTGGSRVMANAGPAVAQTAREVRERATRVAAELLECAPDDVRIAESRAYVAGMPDRSLTLGRIAQAAIRSRAMKATGEPGLHACSYFYPETVTWAFGTQAAAVEVDVETGGVRLLAYAVVHDPGRAVHPVIVEAQLQGGAVQAIGAGLMEQIVYDDSGQLLSGSLMDYAIPRADDLPGISVALTEHRSVINPLGVKGVGESGAIPGAAAIANAIEDAVADSGITLCEVPVTPARLHALLARARAGAR